MMHSALALAFLRVAIDLSSTIPRAKRQFYAIFFESGKRPRVMMRGQLTNWLHANGLEAEARASERRVKPNEIMAWFTSDEQSGLLALPVADPHVTIIALPTDETILSLIDDNEICKEGIIMKTPRTSDEHPPIVVDVALSPTVDTIAAELDRAGIETIAQTLGLLQLDQPNNLGGA